MCDEKISIVAAVNNMNVLKSNLLLSPELANGTHHQLIIKHNYQSASLAYNSAIDEAENDLIIFIHQDIYLPETWFSDLERSLSYLKKNNIEWGVLGCSGCSKDAPFGMGRVYTTGLGVHGTHILNPEPIETLDEIVLIIRRSSGLRFDSCLPHFHLYGTDICLSAKTHGLSCYVIPAFCIHNTHQIPGLPSEYWTCYEYIKRKWRAFLPIYTTCSTISYFNKKKYRQYFSEVYRKLLRRPLMPVRRLEDPRTIDYSPKA